MLHPKMKRHERSCPFVASAVVDRGPAERKTAVAPRGSQDKRSRRRSRVLAKWGRRGRSFGRDRCTVAGGRGDNGHRHRERPRRRRAPQYRDELAPFQLNSPPANQSGIAEAPLRGTARVSPARLVALLVFNPHLGSTELWALQNLRAGRALVGAALERKCHRGIAPRVHLHQTHLSARSPGTSSRLIAPGDAISDDRAPHGVKAPPGANPSATVALAAKQFKELNMGPRATARRPKKKAEQKGRNHVGGASVSTRGRA
jgi:hypothetical protein